ncbi:MAG TPA: START domain-containing protein [bacterium]|jgi:hypothetical protein|nr:START domain-containing protein [bacterium]
MKRFFLLALFIPALTQAGQSVAPSPTAAVSLSSSVVQWNKCSNDNGLTIYWSKVDGSQVIAFRGEGIVNSPMEKVASVIVDASRGTEWINSLVSSKNIRTISNTEFIEYDHVGIPFPFDSLISDRDFVSDVNVRFDPKTKWMTVSYKPTTDSNAPVLKKYTRGIVDCEFKLTRMSFPDQTYVEARVFTDPKGNIPKWLVNFFQQGWPQDTFEGLRKQSAKSDIAVLPVVAQLLGISPEEKVADKN